MTDSADRTTAVAPADLPFTTEVIRSARRTRSVGAQMKGSVLRITVPSWMSRAQEADAVAKMTARFRRSISAERIDLVERAGPRSGIAQSSRHRVACDVVDHRAPRAQRARPIQVPTQM